MGFTTAAREAGRHFGLGVAQLAAGEARQALAGFQRSLELNPYSVATRFNLAVTLRILGRLPEAYAHAARVLEFKPDFLPARSLMGLLCQLAGQSDEALAHWDRALSLDPDYRTPQYYRAWRHWLEGSDRAAREGLVTALEHGSWPSFPPLLQERLASQLTDLLAEDAEDPRPRLPSLCATPVVTEFLRSPSLESLGISGATEVLRVMAVEGRAPGPRTHEVHTVSPAQAAALWHKARSVVVLTGAGASAESGFPTRKALWQHFSRDEAVAVLGFEADPEGLWRVLRAFYAEGLQAPNAAHLALARLPRVTAILTQNVDGLQQRAQPENAWKVPVLELHGSLSRVHCHRCGQRVSQSSYALLPAVGAPRCTCGAFLRPDVVLFGEQVPEGLLRKAMDLVQHCELLVLVGCAMDVAPASELPRLAYRAGATILELKRSPSRLTSVLHTALLPGPAGETLPRLYEALGALENLPPLPEAPQCVRAVQLPASRMYSVPVRLPDCGESVTELVFGQWYTTPEAPVERGTNLGVFETDKACIELEAPLGGRFRPLALQAGEPVQVQQIVGYIDSEQAPPTGQHKPFVPTSLEASDYGSIHREAVEALLVEVLDIPWLQPSHEFSAGLSAQDEASLWLEERFAEHLGALGLPLPQLSPGIACFHDAWEAVAQWKTAWTAPEAQAPETRRWREQLHAHAHALSPRAWSGADPRLRRFWRAVNAGLDLAKHLPDGLGPALAPPALAYLHTVLHGASPNPWRPLLALWARGLWVFPLPGPGLGVFVSTLHEGRMLPRPKAPQEQAWPRLDREDAKRVSEWYPLGAPPGVLPRKQSAG